MKSLKTLSAFCLMICLSFLLAACGSSPVKFKIEFMVDNAVYSTIDTSGNEVISMPTDPTKDGFTFDGWYWDNNSWQRPFTASSLLNEPLSSNMKVYAKWNAEDSLEGTQARFDGFGTQESPYIISTAEQLILLSTLVNTGNNYSLNKYFVLENDIDLSEMEWTPIGYLYSTYSNYTRAFQGHFNGNGFKIYNFNITKNNHISSYNNYTYTGIFGYCYNGIILNLGAEDFNIRTSSYSSSYSGGLVGYNDYGTIENCYATGDVSYSSLSSSFSFAGGLVGHNSGTIENCYATGDVSSTSSYSDAGGLVGINDGTIENCYATGDVSSSASSYSSTYYYSYAGGLVGYNDSGTITNCYATGDVSSSASSSYYFSSNAGGLVGYNDYSGTITNCYATGNVSSSTYYYSYAGGLVGYNDYGTIENCYATGDVSSTSSSSPPSYAGGLVGRNDSGTITNCYATGDVSSSSSSYSYAGGLVGRNSGTITNCYRYIGQIVYPGNSTGNERTLEQLNLTSFYLDDLGWSEDVWNFTDLDFEQGKYPILKAI